MLGHGRLMMRKPSRLSPHRLALQVHDIGAECPACGSVPEPGFSGTAPGMGAIMMAPGFGLPPRVDDGAALLRRSPCDTTPTPPD